MTKDEYLINQTDASDDASQYGHKSVISEVPLVATSPEEKKIFEFRPNWPHIALIIALIICQSIHTGYVTAT